MQFLKGLILNIGVDCWIATKCDVCVHRDGSEYEKQVIGIDKNDDDLNKVINLFKSMNVTFDIDGGRIGCKKVPAYELSNFRLIEEI